MRKLLTILVLLTSIACHEHEDAHESTEQPWNPIPQRGEPDVPKETKASKTCIEIAPGAPGRPAFTYKIAERKMNEKYRWVEMAFLKAMTNTEKLVKMSKLCEDGAGTTEECLEYVRKEIAVIYSAYPAEED